MQGDANVGNGLERGFVGEDIHNLRTRRLSLHIACSVRCDGIRIGRIKQTLVVSNLPSAIVGRRCDNRMKPGSIHGVPNLGTSLRFVITALVTFDADRMATCA
jgi:hypothetical protein